MFKFLLSIFVLFLFLIAFFVRILFGGLFRTKSNRNRQQSTNHKQNQTTQSSDAKKIIASDEGEYVDYEEVKD